MDFSNPFFRERFIVQNLTADDSKFFGATYVDIGEEEWEKRLEQYGLKVEEFGTEEEWKKIVTQPLDEKAWKHLEELMERERILMNIFREDEK